ncbi:MAG: ATP-binding protein [Cyanobacteria bacterium RU_5_0]|nr:ATP-binding protein [Cyanobacteria bacterium RU_5_0]
MALNYLTEIYSSFEPFELAPKEAYVDCQEVRGKWDVVRELGYKITRSKKPTCQLYSGHRGVGKSTELQRLREYLEKEKFFVVYFAADEQDIEPQDVEYADILFACTRHLVEAIKLKNHNPLLKWMNDRWESLKDLALTEVSFEGLSLEGQISQFSKITATLKAVPDKRREMRRQINANTPSLVEALNDFIREAQQVLPPDRDRGLVVIVDNLDRIAETQEENRLSNYDEIYLNRSEMLRGLVCHVIYTVPIAMIYSERATRLPQYRPAHFEPPKPTARKLSRSLPQHLLRLYRTVVRAEIFYPSRPRLLRLAIGCI